jgi:hypothetical protein
VGNAFQHAYANMINHARTLLLNIDGTRYQPQYLGEEYIPPAYSAVTLPSYIQAARRILFGGNPERVFLNYRIRELLHTIHETELAEYLFALDPRVTYWPEQDPVFFAQHKRVQVTQTTGIRGARLFVSGRAAADHARGVAFREFSARVDRDDLGDHYMTIRYGDNTQERTQIDVSSGLSSPVPVRDTQLLLRVGGSPIFGAELVLEDGYPILTEALENILLEYGNIYDGYDDVGSESLSPFDISVFDRSAWDVSVFTPPSAVVGLVPLLEVIGAANIVELFGADNKTEPFATFKNIWFDHPSAIYRVAAFTLAMIYRTEQVRLAQSG